LRAGATRKRVSMTQPRPTRNDAGILQRLTRRVIGTAAASNKRL
jgi:hypothetical protein